MRAAEREVALIPGIGDEIVERGGIPERRAIGRFVGIQTHENPPYGDLESLARERVRYVQHLVDLVGHMAR